MGLDELTISRRCEQATPMLVDEGGRFESCYGSAGG
jgi:hypothetical protein